MSRQSPAPSSPMMAMRLCSLAGAALLAGLGIPAAAQSVKGDVDPEDAVITLPDRVDEPVAPVVPAAEVFRPSWTLAQARSLGRYVAEVGGHGLNPSDYMGDALEAAILMGPGEALDEAATRSFSLIATHMRDGRTPNSARRQWFVNDTDAARDPMLALLTRATGTDGDPAAVLRSLEPSHPDYGMLRAALSKATDARAKARLVVNLERWRWMPRDLGSAYIVSNVPEMMTRVVENGVVLATHKAVVGKPTTPTPQLDAKATAIILNPTWTLPRSIIAEGTGALIARNPAAARARGYTWTGSGPTLSVVQKPGPGNALGRMKLEMLNPHAIYLHDTPSKGAFAAASRAFSHGCIRTDRALHFSGLMAVRYGQETPEVFGQTMATGKTARIAFKQPFPVYIGYWTASPNADGTIATYSDLYGRDAPVVTSLSNAGRPAEIATRPIKVAAAN